MGIAILPVAAVAAPVNWLVREIALLFPGVGLLAASAAGALASMQVQTRKLEGRVF